VKAILAIWVIVITATILYRTRQSGKLSGLVNTVIENRCARYNCFSPIGCWNWLALFLALAVAMYFALDGYPNVFLLMFLFASISLACYLPLRIIFAENGILYETTFIDWQDISFWRIFRTCGFHFLYIRVSTSESDYTIPISGQQVNQLITRKLHLSQE
jgi:hypothetical protein